jgi:hypothetical protein
MKTDTVAMCTVCWHQVELFESFCHCGEHLLCEACKYFKCKEIDRAMLRAHYAGATRRFYALQAHFKNENDWTPIDVLLPEAREY